MNENKKILIDLLLNRFQFITSADNSVEMKSTALFSFSVAIFLAFWIEVYPKMSISYKIFEARVGLACLIISIGISIFCILASRKYRSGIANKETTKKQLILDTDKFLDESIDALQKSVDSNALILKNKSDAFKLSILFFITGICLLGLSIYETILI